VAGAIGFNGRAVGSVYLRLSLKSASLIASRILGLESPDSLAPNEIDDAVGELLNIVTGNFKSNLSDAGLPCRLQTPQVMRSDQFIAPRAQRNSLERMAFRGPELLLFVDASVNPWSD
jgi:CheY-specific phosphatase CheX